jgi:hypothetical protein
MKFDLLNLIFVLNGDLTDQIPDWWIWAYWISPMMYAQDSLVINEFLADRWKTVRMFQCIRYSLVRVRVYIYRYSCVWICISTSIDLDIYIYSTILAFMCSLQLNHIFVCNHSPTMGVSMQIQLEQLF